MPTVEKQLEKYRSMRDFSKTKEPAGGAPARARKKRVRGLRFVVQKHAATALHYDLRLELDGVMKSWAVPKGPSLDPSVKRLAMQVEDHPIEYNTFEGTIPEGEYGGGTVMIWDEGVYTAEKTDGKPEDAIRAGLERGDLKVVFAGERLKGSFVLVRTRPVGGRQQWLLIKHRDEFAEPGSDITAQEIRSAVSGRTMEEIATENTRVWHSNRVPRSKVARTVSAQMLERARRADAGGRARPATRSKRAAPRKVVGAAAKLDLSKAITPMLASPGRDLPAGDDWVYEPKYDGIRVLAFVVADDARLITRNLKDKTKQFPEIIADLRKLSGKTGKTLVLDGEIVALVAGQPGRFQELQSRMHVDNALAIERRVRDTPVALLVFDLLAEGTDVLVAEPWSERRKRLEKRLARRKLKAIRLGESSDDGEAMLRLAQEQGWEGIIAKRATAPYRPGVRSKDWLKLKIEQQQEFVVGGYTEPRNTRSHLGAILLGYYDTDGKLIYAGHTGGGFSGASLHQMYELLHPLERKTAPFSTTPKTNEKPHWTEPRVVVEVRFNEWTRDGKLRQPIFLGIRDDKDPKDVRREP
jgi:bifunctional non-homologous end joining protein LigD